MALPLLRTSERNAFKRCQWMWYHEYRLGLKEIDPKPTAADFGSGMHWCAARWYKPGKKRGIDPRESWEQWCADHKNQYVRTDDFDEDGPATFEDVRELGIMLWDVYLAEYGNDDHINVIAPEQRFRMRIPHPTIAGRTIVVYVGTFDLIYRNEDTGEIEILETKNTNRNLERYMQDTFWAEQFAGYAAVATDSMRRKGKIKPTESVTGFTYNLIRRAKPDTRPVNDKGQACNKPVKNHYIEALCGLENPDNTSEQSDPLQADRLQKLKLEDLAALAAIMGVTVLGDVSARQSGPMLMRETYRRTTQENKRQIERIGEEALHMRAVRNGALPILKTPTMDCGWQCRFFQLCQIDENGDDYDYFKATVFEQLDPYADHRSGATNSKV